MPIDYQYIDRTLRDFKYVLIKTRQQLEELKQQINQTLTDIRSFNKLVNENQCRAKQQDSLLLTDCILPLTQTCKKCLQKFTTFNQLLDHNKSVHERCSQCMEIYLESVPQHQDFMCGSVKLHCEICFANVERKQIDRHVKICSFRKCHKCNLNVYVKGFGYHLKVCGKENLGDVSRTINMNGNQNDGNLRKANQSERSGRKEREEMSMLPCSLWIR